MLTALHIRNFALIDSLDIEFAKGLTVFTGETGSGKSIILSALHLIMGERADYSTIRNTAKKTIVEANFSLSKSDYISFFEENNLDFNEDTIIRREISTSGNARAFINDTPVQLNKLQELTSSLIKIHSQYHTYSLKSKRFQLNLLDDLIGNNLTSYQENFKEWKDLQTKINDLQNRLNEAERQTDYIQFQLDELHSLNLDKTDYVQLENQLNHIENAADIIRQFVMIDEVLGSEDGIISRLKNLNNHIIKSSNLHPELSSMADRIQSIITELRDINETAIDTGENFDVSADEKETLTLKLDNYNRILQKHRLDSQEKLMNLLKEYAIQTSSTDLLKEELTALQKQLAVKDKLIYDEASKLHEYRNKQKQIIINQIINYLKDLKMNHAEIAIKVDKLETLNEVGFSDVEIFFTTNKGSELKPISKTASGGELSRLMLVIENLLSEKKELPTLLLDEIDTGVSGEVALKMGQMLEMMGKKIQLFAITHLPQVAAKGQHHFKVFKKDIKGETLTMVRQLNTEERLVEIAGLMSGENVNDAAIENAKILMNL